MTVGAPNDKYEQEADQVADQVVQRLAQPEATAPAIDNKANTASETTGIQRSISPVPAASNLQRQDAPELEREAEETEEESIQRKPIFDSPGVGEETIQRKCATCEAKEEGIQPKRMPALQRSGDGSLTTSDDFSSRLQRSKGSGRPMDSGTRSSMEGAMGADFSGVRVHTGSEAAGLSNDIGAQAFTHGSDVYFGDGKYDPGSSSGQHLLAHELTHTVQQGGSSMTSNIQADFGDWVGDAWDATGGAVIDAGAELAGDVADSLGISIEALRGQLADFVDKNIPGYSMLSVALGYDLLRGKTVARSMDNILKGVFSLINPLGSRMYELLKENKIVNDAFQWINKKLDALGLTYAEMTQKLNYFLDNVILATTSPIDDNVGLFKQTFGSIFRSILSFVEETGSHVFNLIKQTFLDILVSLARKIGGYDLLCDLLGYDIVTKEERNASTADILRGILKLPIIQALGGDKLLAKLEEHNLIDKTANWIDKQWALLKGGFTDLAKLKDKFLNGFSMETLWKPMEFVTSIKDEVFGFVSKILSFFKNLATKALEIIKEALIWVLKKFVNEKTYGFELVKVILGKDPFTDEPYPRNAENIICAFLKLLPSGEALCEKMKETGAIQKTTQWIMGAIAEFVAILGAMKEAFIALWQSASIDDLFAPIGFFVKIVNLFKEPVLKLVAFVKRVLTKIFEILLQIMQFPANMAKQIIENIKQAFEDIKRDPIGFLMKLLEAVKEGFAKFFDNIGKHLLAGVSGWLFGQVAKAGISPPSDFSLGSILGFVLQILDLTVERLWAKLAEKIGQDKVDKIRGAIDKLKGVWLFVKDVVQNGFSAVWKYIKEKISNLWNIVLEEVKSWVITKVIEKVVTKLLSMLDPTGIMAVVNGFMAFFKAIQSFMEYFKQMLEIVNTFVGGMAEIAKGVISKAADFLENGLAKALPVALGFLANQVGLGNIGDKLKEIVGKVRGFINKALDWLIEKAMAGMKSIMGLFGGGKKSKESRETEEEKSSEQADDPQVEAQAQLGFADLKEKAAKYKGKGANKEEAEAIVKEIKTEHPVFKKLEVVDKDGEGDGWDVAFSYNPVGVRLDVFDNDGQEDIEIMILPLAEGELRGGKQIGKESGGKIIVSKHYPDYFNNLDLNGKKSAKQALESSDEKVRRIEGMKGGSKKDTRELGKGIEKSDGTIPEGFQRHHLIMEELGSDPILGSFLTEIGFNLQDGSYNGIALPRTAADRAKAVGNGYQYSNATLHNGSHGSAYKTKIRNGLGNIVADFNAGNISETEALSKVKRLTTKIKVDLLNGTLKLN